MPKTLMKSLRWLLRPKVLLPLALLVGLVGLAGWFYRYNQTPAVGTIQPAAVQPQPKAVTLTNFKSASIAFQYPVTYSLESKEAAAAITEQYDLKLPGADESRRITITVKKPAAGETLFDDSAYKFRSLKTAGYQLSDVTVDGRAAKKMAKQDGTELTYFIPGDRFYAIVAATSTNPKDAFADEIARVMQSFVWVR